MSAALSVYYLNTHFFIFQAYLKATCHCWFCHIQLTLINVYVFVHGIYCFVCIQLVSRIMEIHWYWYQPLNVLSTHSQQKAAQEFAVKRLLWFILGPAEVSRDRCVGHPWHKGYTIPELGKNDRLSENWPLGKFTGLPDRQSMPTYMDKHTYFFPLRIMHAKRIGSLKFFHCSIRATVPLRPLFLWFQVFSFLLHQGHPILLSQLQHTPHTPWRHTVSAARTALLNSGAYGRPQTFAVVVLTPALCTRAVYSEYGHLSIFDNAKH